MKKTTLLSGCIILCLLSIPSHAVTELKTDKQKLSYALGAYFTQGIKQQNIDLDIPIFLQAVEESLKKTPLKMSESEIETVLNQYRTKLASERNAVAGTNKTAGQKFLESNKIKEGVVTRPSGLQYKIIKEGTGAKPSSESNVKVHYQGTLIDGKVFDSSYKRGEPVSFSLNQVIKGWQEVLPLMSVGSKWQVCVPPELAYGERGASGIIGPNATLIFDIELIGIN
jgi:FKBP-type peptidyl-prolyl cis-trans isomerase FklB